MNNVSRLPLERVIQPRGKLMTPPARTRPRSAAATHRYRRGSSSSSRRLLQCNNNNSTMVMNPEEEEYVPNQKRPATAGGNRRRIMSPSSVTTAVGTTGTSTPRVRVDPNPTRRKEHWNFNRTPRSRDNDKNMRNSAACSIPCWNPSTQLDDKNRIGKDIGGELTPRASSLSRNHTATRKKITIIPREYQQHYIQQRYKRRWDFKYGFT